MDTANTPTERRTTGGAYSANDDSSEPLAVVSVAARRVVSCAKPARRTTTGDAMTTARRAFRVPVLSLTIVSALAAATAATAPTAVFAQARPMIEHISPTSGPPGTRVTITGRNFRSNAQVLFNDQPIEIAERRPERIVVAVPSGAPSGRFVVRHGTDEVESELFRLSEAAPAPRVTAIEPTSAAPGSEVVIRGENFGARPTDNTVRMGTLPLIVRSAEPTSLRVIVPDGAQTGPVTVRTSGGESASAPLTIAARVTIREFTPTAAAPGQRVLIRGTGFSTTAAQPNAVTLGGRAVRVLRASASELEIEVPRDQTQGGTLRVIVPGAGQFETGASLRVAPAPLVASIEPAQGAPGSRVTFHGERFGSDPAALRVTLGDTVARVLSVTPDTAVVEVPRGAGSGRWHLTAGGIGPVDAPVDYRVLEPVAIAGFTPPAGDVGDRVSIQGTGFSPNAAENTVRLGQVPARVVSVGGREIVVEVPESARSGQFTVNVTGNGEARARQPFMVTLRPRITALDPDRGILGTRVTLRGTNFPADRALVQVRLNDIEVPVESVSREAIVVTVPTTGFQPGPATFSIIARLQGTGRAPMEWFVLVPSRITAADPADAPVGARVTIRGEGFESDPRRLILRLNGTAIRPTSASTTAIEFTVPRGATSGELSVEAEGRQRATTNFRVTNPPTIASFSPAQGAGGSRITIRGDHFGADPAAVTVHIGTAQCTVSVVTPRQIIAEVPATATGGQVIVRVRDEGEAQGRREFRVTGAAAPASR